MSEILTHYIEKHWITEDGYQGLVVLQSTGYRCGYIIVPKVHITFGMPYDNFSYDDKEEPDPKEYIIEAINNITVHGGLTYSSIASDFIDKKIQSEPGWMFGFDCAHFNDKVDYEAIVLSNLNNSTAFSHVLLSNSGEIRTQKYVEDEVNSLIDQFRDIANLEDPNKEASQTSEGLSKAFNQNIKDVL